MSDAPQTPERQALAEISLICSGALSHGADSAGVVEIIEGISAKARAPLMAAPSDSVARLQRTMAEIDAWIEDDESAPRVEDAIHHVTGLMLRLHDGVKALGLVEGVRS